MLSPFYIPSITISIYITNVYSNYVYKTNRTLQLKSSINY